MAADGIDPREWQTRQEIIDQRLRLAGWNVEDRSHVVQELEIASPSASAEPRSAEAPSRYDGTLFADYALLLDGRPAAVIEAVHRAFDGFIADHSSLSAMQIRFLQALRTFILHTGRVERRNLIEAPFTQFQPQGIPGSSNPGRSMRSSRSPATSLPERRPPGGKGIG